MGHLTAHSKVERFTSRKPCVEKRDGQEHGLEFRVFNYQISHPLRLSIVIGFLLISGFAATAVDATRTQTIQLTKGWNAVFLEVEPPDSSPLTVFSGTPIDLVAVDYERTRTAQFVSNPDVNMFRQAGWAVWYSGDRQESFLSNLHGIHGQRGYLIHSKSEFVWNVEGLVIMPEIRWRPGAYSLVGFGLSQDAPPTFFQFFRNSSEHDQAKIYRLVSGVWRRVVSPDAEAMRSGEAFWIYCDGASDFTGPLHVKTPTRVGLLLGGNPANLELRNESEFPITPTIDHVVSTGAASVPMSFVIRVVGEPNNPIQSVAAPKPIGEWTQSLPPIEEGSSIGIPVEMRPEDMSGPMHASLLKISTDLGTVTWVPVYGVTEDSNNE